MMNPRTKDRLYDLVPMPVLQQVLPRLTASRSPFLPEIVERRVIFVHVPKAAGTSLKTELYGRPMGGHRSIAEFTAYDPVMTREFFTCAFVRNPWDRLLSAYSYLVQGVGVSGRDRTFAAEVLAEAHDFEAFVLRLEHRGFRERVIHYDHFRSQAHWICLPGRREHAMDFLGRFESLPADLGRLRRELDGTAAEDVPGEVVEVRASQHDDYRSAYSDRTRDTVAELYGRDLELLGYDF